MSAGNSSLGLGGYDAVSYFAEGRPRVGKFDYKAPYQGRTFCFFTQENMEKFKKKPENFAPQFGGNCAFACGLMGSSKVGNPQNWKIVAGKLYLFSNPVVAKIWEFLPFLIERGHSNFRARPVIAGGR